jgi:hypothetical protein
MKKNLLIAFALFAAGLTGCGLQEDEGDQVADDATPPADTTPPDDSVPADTLPAPFRSPAANVYDFSTAYVSGATCGEVRGSLPGMSWTDGVQIANPDGDGYMGMSFITPAGTYELSYLGWQNCGTREPKDAWAQYGFEEQLVKMTAEARSFLNCNWWNATTQQKVTGVNPSCDIRITVDTVGNILPAGNMANFAGL